MKEWNRPEFYDLSISETAGGPVYDPESDGDTVYDPETNKWWTPSGHTS